MAFLLCVLYMLFMTSSSSRLVYDLTHPMKPGMPHSLYKHVFNQSGIPARQHSLNNVTLQSFCALENAGTHLNAPFKTNKYEWTLDKIPIKNLIAPLIIIRLGHSVRKFDLKNWEIRHKPIPKGSVVVLDSDWAGRWNYGRDTYMGVSGVDNSVRYPGFDIDACEYLVSKRVIGVGVDTISVDGGKSNGDDYSCQSLLSDNHCYVLENLNNLYELPEDAATIFVGTLNIEGATGSPARILAYVESGTDTIQFWWELIAFSWMIAAVELYL